MVILLNICASKFSASKNIGRGVSKHNFMNAQKKTQMKIELYLLINFKLMIEKIMTKPEIEIWVKWVKFAITIRIISQYFFFFTQ